MIRLFAITFAVLGWSWYELSGGSEFVAGENGLSVVADVDQSLISEKVAVPEVARADTTGALLASIGEPKVVEEKVAKAVVPTYTPKPVITIKPIRKEQPVEAVVTQASVVSQASSVDFRFVTGSRVNVRNGPGTTYPVVTKLVRGDEVEVLQDAGDGWVKLRSLNGSRIGWMSDDFLQVASN